MASNPLDSSSPTPPPCTSTANSLLASTNIPLQSAGVIHEDVPLLVMPPPSKEPHQYDSKKTKEATKYSAKIFRDFCHSRGINTAIEDMAKSELDELLSDFYINVRTQGGQFYSFSSLVALRHGLNRYLKTVNIVNDPAFRKSNMSFKVALKRLKEAGKGSIEHKEPISQADMATLYSHSQVFNPNTPEGLLNKVWFEITFYFFRRGQENQRYLTPHHFGFGTDEYGRKYVYKRKSLSQYTNGCSIESNSSPLSPDSSRSARMYATGNAVCPVATFERYLRKRNPHELALFQHPRTTSFQDSIWYNASPLGKEALSTMMKRIALTAKLSRVYTNHCIRATAKFVLFQVFDAFQFDPQQGTSSSLTTPSQSLALPGISSISGLNTLSSHEMQATHDTNAGSMNYSPHPSGLRVSMVQTDTDNTFPHLPNLSEIALNRQEAMEVQSAVAAATGAIIGQPEVETYEPEPVHTIQNSKIRINQEKDLSVSFSASSRPATVFKKTYVDPEHADGMMKSLASLWRKRRLCDAKICSGNKNVTLHRLVLFAASPHLMEKNITDGADLEVNLPPGISEDGLKIFVSFLYDGVLNLNEHLYKDVERISNLLKVDKIQKHCREFAASLNEHKQMTSSPSTLTPRHRDSLPKSQSNRQTVVLTLSDDSNPADVTFDNQEQNVGLSHSHLEDVHNSLLDERLQSLNEQHNYLTSHQNQFPSTSQASSMSLQGSSSVSGIPSECGIKTEPIEILDDDVTDYNLSQEDIKQCKPNINQSGKGYTDDSSNSEPHRRSSQGHISSKVTRTYMTPSKCESGIELTPMESISTCATTGASPYPVSLVASSGETFPLYTLSSNQS
ncbi:XP_029650369.1uncharacterized protein LOC115223832 isoform X1 [Octopus vulgaris]|uniref:XP_029650369.1uncharacterized protein LOC115223832 isoform X1 n=2 Tax=Octopus TaxID=6643 RepID=A0AA36BST1_OCTVU|nr:uncharacterized protein LOC115223832 isoform X1 [Octopus sinensis]CAI9739953.1 XP_029650369.1uncharacterized protein LOC115223832 isoform X1 [Octopus vulgaris]